MAKVIAELGINHNGSFSKLKRLIDSANDANVYAMKFQYRRNSKNCISDLEIGSTLIKDELNFYQTLNIQNLFMQEIRIKWSKFLGKRYRTSGKKFIFDLLRYLLLRH